MIVFTTEFHFFRVMNSYSFSTFYCTPSEPQFEWFFALLVTSIGFFFFFAIYFYRIIFFHKARPELPWFALATRIFFAFSLLIKGVFLCVEAFGYNYQWYFSVFKYAITDLPNYVICAAYAVLLYSWCKVLSSSSLKDAYQFFKKVRIALVLFTSFIFFTFACLLGARSFLFDESLKSWYIVEVVSSIFRELFLALLFIYVLYVLNHSMNFQFSLGLGNPQHYIFTICMVIIIVQIIGIGILSAIFGCYTSGINECSETRLVLVLFYECLKHLLPLGFLTIVDVFTIPHVAETSGPNRSFFMD